MTEFTRVTVIGASRRATLVLPSDEPVSTLLPDIAELLAELPPPNGHVLVSTLGDEFPATASLSEHGVANGAVFRLISASLAPAPPEVTDVIDAVADAQDESWYAWNSTHRTVATGVALGALTLIVTQGLPEMSWLPLSLFLLFTTVAAVLGWSVSPRFGLLAAAPALGATPLTTIGIVSAVPLLEPVVWPIAMALGWVAVAVAGSKRAVLGGAVGVLLAAVTVVASVLGASPAGVAAVIAICTAALLGALPSIALALSGVTLLDDRGLAGESVRRITVSARVTDAYGMFTWAIAATSGYSAFALAVLLSSNDVFALSLGAALLAIVGLRTRVMPMAVQAWMLWGAVISGVLVAALLTRSWSADVLALLGVGGAGLIVLLGTIRPRPHTRVRLRRFGDFLEALAALTMLPLTLGVFGVYPLLLGVF
ncbi:hypothetical protein QFZ53_002829 [Microbacterium natoriense]|uniref:EccD-like transmembrane domain-containing protein n=1 Tax=Microbacterium natoriense TaxID=284570 RepID=A0AAW8EZ81_9MICO|nr:EsaB/YukD family protein [Microbacterium natoriense]MDQ0648633.1 hypothetical protein [Microbacterium natoriense]